MLKKYFLTLMITIALLAALETGARLTGAPPGASDFVEAIVLRNGLTPEKPPHEIRIFAFGESTFHGSHYAPYSNPVRWLELYLKDFLPDKTIRIINFARPGRGIHFTFETFRSALYYRPDYAVFYNGHNDFFPHERKDDVLQDAQSWEKRLKHGLIQSRFLAAVYRNLIRYRMHRDDKHYEDRIGHPVIETPPGTLKLSDRVIASRHESFYWENITFFKTTLLEILRLAKANHIPLLFLNPVSNLKDFAPIESIHHRPLIPEALAAWEHLYETGTQCQAKGLHGEALHWYRQATSIDPTHAELNYRMGQAWLALGHVDEARQRFEAAKDYDAVPLRATREIQDIYRNLAAAEGLFLLDPTEVLQPELLSQILGEPLFEDNVHLSLRGHSLVGKQIARAMAGQGWIAPETDWQWHRERPFDLLKKELSITEDLIVYAMIKVADYYASRFEERIRFAQKAVALAPENTNALRALAWAYWVAGQKERAAEIYRMLKQKDFVLYEQILGNQPTLRHFLESQTIPST